eukprot:gene24239-32591_t
MSLIKREYGFDEFVTFVAQMNDVVKARSVSKYGGNRRGFQSTSNVWQIYSDGFLVSYYKTCQIRSSTLSTH